MLVYQSWDCVISIPDLFSVVWSLWIPECATKMSGINLIVWTQVCKRYKFLFRLWNLSQKPELSLSPPMLSIFVFIPLVPFHVPCSPLVNPVGSVKAYSAPTTSTPSSTAWPSAKPPRKLLIGVPRHLSTHNQYAPCLAAIAVCLQAYCKLVFSPATAQMHCPFHSHSWLTLPLWSRPSLLLDIFIVSSSVSQHILDIMVAAGCLNQANFLLPWSFVDTRPSGLCMAGSSNSHLY